MKSTEFTESKYLNAKSAGQYNGKTLTIYECKAEMIGRDEDLTRKLTVGFEGVEKRCVINRTNNEILTEAFGEETDNWTGRKVILHIVMQQFKGQRKPGIQLEPVTRTKPGIQEDAEQIEKDGEFVPLNEAALELGIDQDHTTSPPLGSAEEHSTPKRKSKK